MPSWYKLSKIYVGTNQVRPVLTPSKYVVNSHTLCYLPLTDQTTTTDYWTLWWTWTKAGSNGWTFIDNYYRSWWNGDYWRLQTGTNAYVNYPTFTFSVWLKMSSNLNDFIHISNYGNWDNWNLSLYYNQARFYSWSTYSYSISPTLNTGTRTLLTITYSQSNKWNLYVDWTLRGTRWPTNFNLKPYIAFVNWARLSGGSFSWDMCYSDYILEDQEWTAQNVADYYNANKSNYWL